MPSLWIEDGTFYLEGSDIDSKIRMIIEDAGGQFDPIRGVWFVTFTMRNYEFLTRKIRTLRVADDVREKVSARQKVEDRLEEIRRMSSSDASVRLMVPGLKGTMYNYQKLGVMFGLRNGEGFLCADEMGLGKSVQAIAMALVLKSRGLADKALVVTPASLKWNWPLEIEKWTDEPYVVIDGPPDARIAQWRRTDVFFFVVNHELLLEDLFGGRSASKKAALAPEPKTLAAKEKAEKQRARREKIKAKAETRARVLRQVRQRKWGMVCIDECFHPDTRITLWDGSKVSLSKVVCEKASVLVPAYDEGSMEFVPCRVVGWFKNSVKQCWRVRTDGGTSYPSLDHQYVTPEGLVSAGDLRVGDDILFMDEGGVSEVQMGALAGTLLGDGSLSLKVRDGERVLGRRARLYFNHGTVQREYAEFKTKLFGGDFTVRTVENKGWGDFMVMCCGKSVITRTDYERFYRGCKKTVTDEWMDLLTPLGLALWLMDDGSVNVRRPAERWGEMMGFLDEVDGRRDELAGMGWRNLERVLGVPHGKARAASRLLKGEPVRELYARRSRSRVYVTLHTEGFPKDQVIVAVRGLNRRWGLEAKARPACRNGRTYWMIRFSVDGGEKLLGLVAPFVPECMRYKLGGMDLDGFNLDLSSDDFRVRRRARVSKIREMAPHKKPCGTYNIMVEGVHKYVAGGAVVANCHQLKNRYSKRNRNVSRLRADFRMALTGTPLDGRLEELHSVMDLVAPGLLQSRTKFLQRHADTDHFGKITGYKRISEVRNRIMPFFLRRKKEDVWEDMPEKTYANRVITLSPSEAKIYKELAEHGHELTEDVEALVAVIRCKQFCDAPELIDPDLEGTGSKLADFRLVLEEIRDNDWKALVFTQYAKMVPILCGVLGELGIGCYEVTGATPTKERADVQAVFNGENGMPMVVGTEAMSTGLNFQAADVVVNYDDNWAPAVMRQREDRAHRNGRKGDVLVVNFVCRDTIEQRIRGVLVGKETITVDVLGDDVDESVIRRLGPRDIARLL